MLKVKNSLRTTHGGRVRRTTRDGQRLVTIANPEHFVLRWAKKAYNDKNIFYGNPINAEEMTICYYIFFLSF